MLEDLVHYLRTDKILILKSFLKIKHILERSEPRYLFNTLYIDDFCVFLQSVDKKVYEDLATQIEGFKIEKSELGLGLEEIEKDALALIEEGDEEDEDGENAYKPVVLSADRPNIEVLAETVNPLAKDEEEDNELDQLE